MVLSDVNEALPLLKRNVVANHLGSRCATCAVQLGGKTMGVLVSWRPVAAVVSVEYSAVI